MRDDVARLAHPLDTAVVGVDVQNRNGAPAAGSYKLVVNGSVLVNVAEFEL
tara:strand:+ start:61334 stop:61486 length:153 start_codon:yes stop_codon:yes gene_type:complete